MNMLLARMRGERNVINPVLVTCLDHCNVLGLQGPYARSCLSYRLRVR